MNRKSAKLLTNYADHSEQDIKDLKKWWKSLSWQEKSSERARMEAEMDADEAPAEEAVAEEE